MNRAFFAIGCVTVITTLLFLAPVSAHREPNTLVGAWSVAVTPQANPNVPDTPAPFRSLLAFERGGTLAETGSGLHPRSAVLVFPELGPLAASDGLGVWEPESRHDYRGRFVKFLFDQTGAQLGYVITRLELRVVDGDRLEGTSDSAFIIGSDPDAAPFFTGGLTRIAGKRLTVSGD